jgi:tetratricopeptide (TPR) repeat protein
LQYLIADYRPCAGTKTSCPRIFVGRLLPRAARDLLKQQGVNENDEILFAGLFAWYPGAKKNYPIVRHGKLALLSQERIPLDRQHPDKTVEVYLADVMSFGGNSGSPVFLRIGGIREGLPNGPVMGMGYSYYLLGVMKGFFPEAMPFELDVAQLYGQSAQNSGIAAVVPADNILHILGSPRAQAYSERVVGGSYIQNGDLGAAEKCYEKAISILTSLVPEHSDLASALSEYALLLRKMNRTTEAGQTEERARRIRSNVQTGRLHPRD